MPTMQGVLNRLLGRSSGTLPFDHRVAQRYELDSAKQTIREAYPALLEKWRAAVARGDPWHNADNHWFDGDRALWV